MSTHYRTHPTPLRVTIKTYAHVCTDKWAYNSDDQTKSYAQLSKNGCIFTDMKASKLDVCMYI